MEQDYLKNGLKLQMMVIVFGGGRWSIVEYINKKMINELELKRNYR